MFDTKETVHGGHNVSFCIPVNANIVWQYCKKICIDHVIIFQFFILFYPFSQFVSCSPFTSFFLYDCCTGINLNVFILFIFNVYTYFKKRCRTERRMAVVEGKLHDRKELWFPYLVCKNNEFFAWR